MVLRKSYLKAIRPFIGKPVIKVITGIRRCGKSVFMKQIMDDLRNNGVEEEQIIYINKELFEFDAIRTYADLHHYVTSKSTKISSMVYLFVDEVQEIADWEKAINSFLAQSHFDIYISGSNARLLSSEFASLLSGRYVEFRINPFTLLEFSQIILENSPVMSEADIFSRYIRYGGFPGVHFFSWDETAIRQYLYSVYNTILLKDIVLRYNIRDVHLLERLGIYLADNCGNITSAKSISDFLKSQQTKVSVDTVQNYIEYCVGSLVVEKVRRFDIKGKRILETHEKYFFNDAGMKNAIIGYLPSNLPGHLENVVFNNLVAKGFQLSVGKQNDREVDFIARKGNDLVYIQVCTMLTDGKTVDREYGSLESINDHFPKYVLSLDTGFETSRKGIRWMNIRDFLMLEL